MGGGAWPFLVGGVICLVNSDNERDSHLPIVRKGCSMYELYAPVLLKPAYVNYSIYLSLILPIIFLILVHYTTY